MKSFEVTIIKCTASYHIVGGARERGGGMGALFEMKALPGAVYQDRGTEALLVWITLIGCN